MIRILVGRCEPTEKKIAGSLLAIDGVGLPGQVPHPGHRLGGSSRQERLQITVSLHFVRVRSTQNHNHRGRVGVEWHFAARQQPANRTRQCFGRPKRSCRKREKNPNKKQGLPDEIVAAAGGIPAISHAEGIFIRSEEGFRLHPS